MRGFFIRWFISVIALAAVLHIVSGMKADTLQTVLIAALVLGLLNAFLKPALLLFTLPLNIVSLGLFTLVINGFLFYLVSKIVKGFVIADFWTAFWGAVWFSVISFLLNLLVSPQGKVNTRFYEYGTRNRKKYYEDVIDVEGKAEDEREDK